MKTKKGSYNAIVCHLSNVQTHPNADRLKIAQASGYSVIVGSNASEGDLGVLFPEGGQISENVLIENSLYRKHPHTGEKMGGYFESSGRVKSCKLRGQISEGFFTGTDIIGSAGVNLKDGDEFCEIDGRVICKKYLSPATIKAINQAKTAYIKPWWVPNLLKNIHKQFILSKVALDRCPSFRKHFDTPKLRNCVHTIPGGLTAILTVKKHGTSGRTGYVPYKSGWFGRPRYRYVTGTRNVTYNPDTFGKNTDTGFYKGTNFRFQAHERVIAKGLRKDEIVYYEILGFSGPSTPIMPNHKLKKSDFKNAGYSAEEFQSLLDTYGDEITYHYGNDPGDFSIEVYRITQDGVDLNFQEMSDRCVELGLRGVHVVAMTTSEDNLMKESEYYSKDVDLGNQLREGIVIRLEDSGEFVKMVKYKSFTFCTLEGIRSNDPNEVNLEEVS